MYMNTMEVELLNAIKYTTKDNRNRTLIKFRVLNDNCVSYNDKFKGVSILDGYFDGHEPFDKIPLDYFGCKVTFTLEKTPSATDPRKETTKIIKINDITLV